MVKTWQVPIDPQLQAELHRSLNAGPIVDDQGRRLLTEAKVDEFGGFCVDIFADEHPPPHFRVRYQGKTANYRITDGTKLNGELDRYQRNIREWYADNRTKLIDAWNRLRPTDCPVGVVKQ